MSYGDREQNWLWSWLVAWWHQAITWTNADFLSVRYSGIRKMAIEFYKEYFSQSLKLACNYLAKLHPNLCGSKELSKINRGLFSMKK